MINAEYTLGVAFIGAGNMAYALSAGLVGKRCAADQVLAIDPDATARAKWQELGTHTAERPDAQLQQYSIWIVAVKPQQIKEVLQACQPYVQEHTLIISVAAGISSYTLATALGTSQQPHQRIIRAMPNTPAFIACGATGLLALEAVNTQEKNLAEQLFKTVGEVVWVDTDADIDAVTALSGSGPAYVFLFLEALIQGAIDQGLGPDQARKLAFATVKGATELAALSPLPLEELKANVTSKGGTTAAALQVFEQQHFSRIVQQAMQAAQQRAAALSNEFS